MLPETNGPVTTLPAQPNPTQNGEFAGRRLAPTGRDSRSTLTKPLYCGIGVLAVALGMLGVVVPGLPTTVFILIAIWAFARSSDTLDRVLIRRNPALRPFLRYLEPGATMPMRAKVISLALMWGATIVSSVLILTRGQSSSTWSMLIVVTVVIAAGLGTTAILCYGRKPRPAAAATRAA